MSWICLVHDQNQTFVRRRKKGLFPLLFGYKTIPYLLIIIFLIPGSRQVEAQNNDLSVTISYPSEGETFYAGPTSLFYTIDIRGWVVGSSDPSAVQVQLEIFQDDLLSSSLTAILNDDGSYSFPVTVNPEGTDGDFTPVQVEAGCENCHYLSTTELPSKSVLFRITALDLNGRKAYAERNIVVDRSDKAEVPVLITLIDDPEKVIKDINVQASTRLYLWRARRVLARSNQDGIAYLKVEALAEAPTHYVFQVEPTVIDGVLYEGIESVELTLPPGATSAPLVTLQVRGQLGTLYGHLVSSEVTTLSSTAVWAISLRDGHSYQTYSNNHGFFKFPEIPVDRYLISTDPMELAQLKLRSESHIVDLFQSIEASVVVAVLPIKGQTLTGKVFEEQGGQLPFARISIEETGQTQRTISSDGKWSFLDVPFTSITLSISAPGYFSRLVSLSLSSLERDEQIELALRRRPETKSLFWGSGEVIIPQESQAHIESGGITLDSGWLWGSGGEREPLHINTPSVGISLYEGTFALEYLPGEESWLYMTDGLAIVQLKGDETPVEVPGGWMLSLTNIDQLAPVPLSPVVDAGTHNKSELLISSVYEVSPEAKLKSDIVKVGIGVAQVVTLITYVIAFLLLVIMPLRAIRWWRNR